MLRIRMVWAAFYALALGFTGHASMAYADEAKPAVKPAAKTEAKGQHNHDAHGPHKGALIELGEEEYHGEIVLDEKLATVTIYLLGANAKDLVPIDATELVINLKHGNKPEQFKLKAAPTKTDPKGKSSCFTIKDKELIHDLHHANNNAQMRVKIAGKNFSGKIELDHHDHDHDHAKEETKKKG